MREPGADSFTYINRLQEAAVYAAVRGVVPTDEVVALEPESGRKIAKFWRSARICDPNDEQDVIACMAMIRKLHEKKLHVDYEYNSFELNRTFIGWKTLPSIYPDYEAVEKRCMDMEPILKRYWDHAVLSHCDTVAANFLFIDEGRGQELRLIDWEYAGMHDPCVDIAMFANDGDYSPERTDWLMECYLGEAPTPAFRMRVYGYLALTGLCYSNWEERERMAGRGDEDYGVRQHSHAVRYSRLFWELYPEVEEREAHGES